MLAAFDKARWAGPEGSRPARVATRIPAQPQRASAESRCGARRRNSPFIEARGELAPQPRCLAFRCSFFGFGNFASTGNLLTVAPGFNAVLVQNRLEFGAVYVRPITVQHDFDFNGLLVKIVLRF